MAAVLNAVRKLPILSMLHSKWSPPALPTTSFSGKTVLITGSNVGLGFEAARHFLDLDASRIILAVRNVSKGDDARARLEATSGRRGIIQVLPLDMDSFASVTAFADRINADYGAIDVAILNAGVVTRLYSQSPEGWEETLQVNTLSTTLLALLLLPALRAAGTVKSLPHLVIVSLGRHVNVQRSQFVPSSQNILQQSSVANDAFDGQTQYALSKLFLMYTIKPLAALVTSPDGQVQVLVTSCCPGSCKSDLGRQYATSWFSKMAIAVLLRLLSRTTEEGSRTLVSAAGLGEEAQGGYWQHDKLQRFGDLVTSSEGKELQQQLWREIVDVLKAKAPGVESLVNQEK
ncbi:hypothetical protein MMC12_003857 [Toensbergia leucococca]|nr:hypothetical protein [Toensbergia leucococca]